MLLINKRVSSGILKRTEKKKFFQPGKGINCFESCTKLCQFFDFALCVRLMYDLYVDLSL